MKMSEVTCHSWSTERCSVFSELCSPACQHEFDLLTPAVKSGQISDLLTAARMLGLISAVASFFKNDLNTVRTFNEVSHSISSQTNVR